MNTVLLNTNPQSISTVASRSMEEERCTKTVRLKEGEEGEPGTQQLCDVVMDEPKLSYKDKLSKGKALLGEEDPWLLEEEPECEDGDITIMEDENGSKVELSDAFKKRLEKPWEKAVIVKLLGREIGYRALHTKIQSMWKPSGPFRLIDLENNFYIVRFWDSIDYLHALTGGPWVIHDHALYVQPWCQNFRATTGTVEKATVWVHFPDLPVDRYHSKVLKTMGNMVGSTVRIDVKTESQTRAKFAKVAVAVDLTKPLTGVVRLDNEEYMVSYEGLPKICFSCGRYGHSSLMCSHHNPQTKSSASGDVDAIPAASPNTPVATAVLGSCETQVPVRKNSLEVGEWMVAQRRTRRPNRKHVDSNAPRYHAGSSSHPGPSSPLSPLAVQPKVILKSNPIAAPIPRPVHSAVILEEACHRIIYPKSMSGQAVVTTIVSPTVSHIKPVKPPDPNNGMEGMSAANQTGTVISSGTTARMEEDPQISRTGEGASINMPIDVEAPAQGKVATSPSPSC
ncbi:hypothetical protein Tsubulata_000010 [Turnera subulata]|uniref:DUF4283 domain-containing protein n=1 Tax=Turnera subulata TaxID=218843 RepID=A0A9Q0J8Z3_9ROSI|nr:hypothetical protein Tsubulata_000010 [Turnera subulata]